MPTKTAIRKEQDKQRKHRQNITLVIAGIAVALLVGAGQIWYARQQTLNNRPNISVQAIIPKPFTVGLNLVLIARLKNFGNTEAHNVSARSSLVPGMFKTDQDAYDALKFVRNNPPDNYLIIEPGEGMQQN
jgi:hypothetical protein